MITLETSSLKEIRRALRELPDHVKISFHLWFPYISYYASLVTSVLENDIARHDVGGKSSGSFSFISFSASGFHNIAVNGDEWTSHDDQRPIYIYIYIYNDKEEKRDYSISQ